MTNTTIDQSGRNQGGKVDMDENKKVPLKSLSDLTGFPIEFIKKELLLEEEELSMQDLRSSMITYLESTNKAIQE